MANWAEISKIVYQDLTNHAALVALLSNSKESVHQLIADPDEGDFFVTYHAEYNGNPSKDGDFDFTIKVQSFAPTYKEAVAIADEVVEAIKASTNRYVVGTGKPEFLEEGEFYLEQIFNIKK